MQCKTYTIELFGIITHYHTSWVILNTKLCLISNEPKKILRDKPEWHELMAGCPVIWCENGGGNGCGVVDGESTVDNAAAADDDDNDDDILIIAGNTNLEYDSILQASMHIASMLAHRLNWTLLNHNMFAYFPKQDINKTNPVGLKSLQYEYWFYAL